VISLLFEHFTPLFRIRIEILSYLLEHLFNSLFFDLLFDKSQEIKPLYSLISEENVGRANGESGVIGGIVAAKEEDMRT